MLNRAECIPPDERASFRERVEELVDNLLADFEWCRVFPKLLILCCHAPDFLDRLGSIGLFNEQGLEVWHGHDNQNDNALVVPAHLEQCVRLLKKAAVVCGEDESGFKRGKRQLSAAPGAFRATKMTDMRTTRAKLVAGSSPGESAAYVGRRVAEKEKRADNVITAATTKRAAHRRRKNKKTAKAVHSAEAESALMAAAEEERLALLLENSTCVFLMRLDDATCSPPVSAKPPGGPLMHLHQCAVGCTLLLVLCSRGPCVTFSDAALL